MNLAERVAIVTGGGGIGSAGIGGALGLDVSEQDRDRSIDVNLRAHMRNVG